MVDRIGGYATADIMRQDALRRAQMYAEKKGQVQSGGMAEEESIMQKPANSSTDGKDDGKIGFWKATGHTLKGGLKFLGGLVGFDKDWNWSAGRLAKNALFAAGAVAIGVLTGPVGWAVMAGIGVTSAGLGVAKSAYKAYNAKTDAECAAAFEDVGSNSLALAASAVGAKTAMKQVNPNVSYSGFKGTAKASWDATFVGAAKTWNHVVAKPFQAYRSGGWQAAKASYAKSYNTAVNTVKTNYRTATKPLTQDEVLGKYDNKIAKLEAQKAAAKPEAQAKIQKKIDKYTDKRTAVNDAYNKAKGMTRDKLQAKINELETNISSKRNDLLNAADDAAKEAIKKDIQIAKTELSAYKQAKYDFSRTAKMEFADKQKAFDKAQSDLVKAQNANKKYSAGDPSDEAMLAKLHLDNAQTAYNSAAKALKTAKSNQSKYANGSTDYLRLIKSTAEGFGRTAYNQLGSTNLDVPLAGKQVVPLGGKKVWFTDKTIPEWTMPSVAGKQFGKYTVPTVPVSNTALILSTQESINPTVGGPSVDEIMLSEMGLTAEQIKAYKQMQGNQAASQTGQPAASQGGQGMTPADYQALEYLMKAYGVA